MEKILSGLSLKSSPKSTTMVRHRTGHWLPADHAKMRAWVDEILKRSKEWQKNDEPMCDVLCRFKNFIDRDPIIRMLATEMFQEVPVTPPYNQDPTKLKPQIRTYQEMFECLEIILKQGPQWFNSDDPDAMGLIGFPINAIIDWPMGTRSGYDFFTRPNVNAYWQEVLQEWGKFLAGRDSLKVLDTANGWLSPVAIKMLTDKGNDGVDNYTFEQLFICDPAKEHYGFTSWDDFFTRQFRDNIRPVAYPDDATTPSYPNPDTDPSTIIVNSCESTPCFRKENVQLYDTFWLKSQPYSLADILNGEDKAKPFEGGQVYQAFLSALSYHRWHSPVSGKVLSIENVPGTYYSENYYEGFANTVAKDLPKPDPNAPNNSQPYIAEVATRGIIHIQADNPKIGHMAIVYIGMCEVSSCDFFVKEGDQLTKGQQIGTFHFGGSTHCMIFRKESQIKFDDPGPYEDEANNKKVNSLLAVAI